MQLKLSCCLNSDDVGDVTGEAAVAAISVMNRCVNKAVVECC